jgi:uncharacterized protein (TIGR03066 family)
MATGRWFLAIVLTLTLGLLATAGGNPTRKLVGLWELTRGARQSPLGSTVEFTAKGKLTLVVKDQGKEERLYGSYQVKENTIVINIKTGDEHLSTTNRIKALTDKVLIVEHQNGYEEEYKRLK